MAMLFTHIAVVGVGLIGGSFAMAARRAGLAHRITGWGGTRSLATALDRGVIDGVEDSFNQSKVSSADLIYLAAPISGIIDFLKTKGNLIKSGAIVTDAGSTKRSICRAAAESLPMGVRFVGGHPMAGSHKTGVEFAKADLFEGAPYAIACEEPDDAAMLIMEVARLIGAKPALLTPEQHDVIAARLSHAPQLLSTALAASVGRQAAESELELSGSGLADMIRLAESDWSVWRDICSSNADQISTVLREVISELKHVTSAIEREDTTMLSDEFTTARDVARVVRKARTA
jgi:prephenate dehydrogenase